MHAQIHLNRVKIIPENFIQPATPPKCRGAHVRPHQSRNFVSGLSRTITGIKAVQLRTRVGRNSPCPPPHDPGETSMCMLDVKSWPIWQVIIITQSIPQNRVDASMKLSDCVCCCDSVWGNAAMPAMIAATMRPKEMNHQMIPITRPLLTQKHKQSPWLLAFFASWNASEPSTLRKMQSSAISHTL